jgi:hypothetical protein
MHEQHALDGKPRPRLRSDGASVSRPAPLLAGVCASVLACDCCPAALGPGVTSECPALSPCALSDVCELAHTLPVQVYTILLASGRSKKASEFSFLFLHNIPAELVMTKLCASLGGGARRRVAGHRQPHEIASRMKSRAACKRKPHAARSPLAQSPLVPSSLAPHRCSLHHFCSVAPTSVALSLATPPAWLHDSARNAACRKLYRRALYPARSSTVARLLSLVYCCSLHRCSLAPSSEVALSLAMLPRDASHTTAARARCRLSL